MKFRTPRAYDARAISAACPPALVCTTSIRMPPAFRRSRTGPKSLPLRPPPAAGFTIARWFCAKVSSSDKDFYLRLRGTRSGLEVDNCRPLEEFPDLFGEQLTLDFHR